MWALITALPPHFDWIWEPPAKPILLGKYWLNSSLVLLFNPARMFVRRRHLQNIALRLSAGVAYTMTVLVDDDAFLPIAETGLVLHTFPTLLREPVNVRFSAALF